MEIKPMQMSAQYSVTLTSKGGKCENQTKCLGKKANFEFDVHDDTH